MPGPGSKKKSKKARAATSSGAPRDVSDVDIPTVLDECVDEISHTEGWEAVVLVLCRLFGLPGTSTLRDMASDIRSMCSYAPEMNTRSGLRKVHVNFPVLQRQLDASYQKYEGNEKVIGGIIGIWGRMAVDAILRDKLVNAGECSFLGPEFLSCIILSRHDREDARCPRYSCNTLCHA